MNKVTLYGLNKAGGYKLWSIETKDEEIHLEHGQENGKIQLKIESVKGKNIGRSNETTPSQQAELEAFSKIGKQKDKGYRLNKEDLVELPLLPMLANDYLKQGHRIKYPCYASAKLDGVRCLAICTEDGIILKSRGGKLYDVKHILSQLTDIMKVGDVWDGELYIHGKYLEEIVSAVKKPNAMTNEISFRIFDVVSEEVFEDRITNLKYIEDILYDSKIYSVDVLPYEYIKSETEMKDWHKMYVAQGYEGIMLRNEQGLYESGKRSADLQKYKEFLDEEFEIVAVGKDKNDNAVLCVFDPTAGETFTVCYGDFEERKNQLENWKAYIGKKLTVKYQTRYKDSKLPQFPTGVIIRDYE
ncbi:DNA ligase [compost metagenome]